jgi:acetyl-CoA acetyltransferase
MKDKGAIVGVGVTPMGKIYDRTTEEFAAEAVHLALQNAGLELHQIDGMLIQSGVDGVLSMGFQNYLGLMDLRLFNYVSSGGAGAVSMVQYAAMAIDAGLADVVACVFADRPLAENRSAGDAYKGRGVLHQPGGYVSLLHAYGYFGANSGYALAARQHMVTYGTTYEHLGQVAVSTRQWAALNPLAQRREPMTMEDHHGSRWVVDPLRLLDCTLVSNGGVAVIVTSSDRARDLRQKPAYIQGMGQGHFGDSQRRGREPLIQTGLKPAAETAYRMAGVTASDISACQLYDCYTYTVIVSLEDAGFCEKGGGGPFVADGRLGPGGALPTNTGGGQLSGYYMWGMTPLSEAVIQLQGNAGERQLRNLEHILVSGNGGLLSYHACLVLGNDKS